MKATFFTIFAALAASAIAAPLKMAASSSNALAQPHSAMTMKRSEFKNSELLKRGSNVVGANNKRADSAESVNSIIRFVGDDDGRTDAYQDEVDAVTDPASVLGKRADDIPASVNSLIAVVENDDEHTDAYQDAVDAVADPASILGKRADNVAESVNSFVVVENNDARTDPYQDEIDAVSNPAEVLG